MHIRLSWNETDGVSSISPASLESMAKKYNKSPIELLDFLQDSIHILTCEYNDAIAAMHGAFRATNEEGNGG